MTELGLALDLTDEDLDRMAEITDEDVLRAQLLWMQLAPRWATNLMLAEAENAGTP